MKTLEKFLSEHRHGDLFRTLIDFSMVPPAELEFDPWRFNTVRYKVEGFSYPESELKRFFWAHRAQILNFKLKVGLIDGHTKTQSYRSILRDVWDMFLMILRDYYSCDVKKIELTEPPKPGHLEEFANGYTNALITWVLTRDEYSVTIAQVRIKNHEFTALPAVTRLTRAGRRSK